MGDGGEGVGAETRKRAAIKAIFAAYVSPPSRFFFKPSLRGWGGDSETMGWICLLVVVDSYAIALIPSLSLPPFFPFLFYLLGD